MVHLGLRTLVLSFASSLGFGGLVFLIGTWMAPPDPVPRRERSVAERLGELTWERPASEQGERLLLHLAKSRRYFLSTEEGVREAGSWGLESDDRLVLQSDAGRLAHGRLQPFARAGERGLREYSLSLDGYGWMTQILDPPFCGWDTLVD